MAYPYPSRTPSPITSDDESSGSEAAAAAELSSSAGSETMASELGSEPARRVADVDVVSDQLASENVAVVARFRPLTEAEQAAGDCCRDCVNYKDGVGKFTVETPAEGNMGQALQYPFDFAHAFRPEDDQRLVYEQTAMPIVSGLVDGLNAAVLAYGQTGSGKTYTMMGAEPDATIIGDPHDDPGVGIVPRLISDVFREIRERTQTGDRTQVSISCSFIELYMEKVRCLLQPAGGGAGWERPGTAGGYSSQNLGISRSDNGALLIESATQVPVQSAEEVMGVLRQGNSARATAATLSNERSSRSHAILVLTLTQRAEDGGTMTSQLYCVDLAGSERQKKTGTENERLAEANKINTSLLSLGKVINMLPEKRSNPGLYIPYRDSKLTRILKNALGGNSRTLVVCCCSPSSDSAQETLSTLRFGGRASCIENTPVAVIKRTAEELEVIVEALEAKLAAAEERLRMAPAGSLSDAPSTAITQVHTSTAPPQKAWSDGKAGGLPVGARRTAAVSGARLDSLNISPTLCTLSGEVMRDPVIAADGHTYERNRIECWLQRHGQVSPMSGTRLPNRALIPNRALRQLIGSIYPADALGAMPSFLDFLPWDVLERVFDKLDAKSLCCAAQCSKDFRELSAGGPWMSLLRADFPEAGEDEGWANESASKDAYHERAVERRRRNPRPVGGVVAPGTFGGGGGLLLAAAAS